MGELVAKFALFFSVIDPIGTVPVFIAFTAAYDEPTRRAIAVKASLAAFGVLLLFVVAGELYLEAIKIPVAAFQIAGGLVLFLFALSMILGESKPDEELKLVDKRHDTAIFPIAVPSLASPGAMLAAVMATDNDKYTVVQQAGTTAMIALVCLIALVLMLLASWVHRLIGTGGASVISRVMGMILASIAVANVLQGLTDYFNL